MKKGLLLAILLVCLCVCGTDAWAVYTVRISDLGNTPLPPNPIKVWGTVIAVSPVRISDGISEITVTGLTAAVDDFVVVTGTWSGGVLTASSPPATYTGPMIYIPEGSFLMGNKGSEGYSSPDELPQHSVTLSSYCIGKYEVTRGEYLAFMNAGGYTISGYWSSAGWSWKGTRTQPDYWSESQDWGSGTFTQTDNHPVVGVSYYEAEAFCKWAGGNLPTEAQWEMAARWTGGDPNVWPWGNTWDAQNCNNYHDNNLAGGGYQRNQTASVGSYSSGTSPSGCQDMAGNVWEWCRDWYDSAYYSQSQSSDPQGPASGAYRVLRGGSWSNNEPSPRCALRRSNLPYSTDYSRGFRLVRDIAEEVVTIPGTPSGSTSSVVNVSYTYSTSGSTCNWAGHTIEYSFNWGDGTSSSWSASTSAMHSWSVLGVKMVRVSARCQVHQGVAATSATLAVSVNDIQTPEMINIPTGDFLMGNSGIGDDLTFVQMYPNAGSEELQHWVSLSGYDIGKYEITRGQYRQFMDTGGYSNSAYWSSEGWSWRLATGRSEPQFWTATQTWGGHTFTQTENHPVVGVCYYEAEAFCNWAGGYLPTEAQWEKASRWTGKYSFVYPWGYTWNRERCNNVNDSLYPGYQTAPVGSYPTGESPSGCQDMAGNVFEWCKDWQGSDYYAQTPAGGWVDPQGPENSEYGHRILRGGGYDYDYLYRYRCSSRYGDNPSYYDCFVGFRLAHDREVISVPPAPTGSDSPVLKTSTTYSTSGATCNWVGHVTEYSFDWGEGVSSTWSTSTSASHSWSTLGPKTVTVSARCQVHPTIMATSDELEVTVGPCEMVFVPAGSFLMGNNGSEEFSNPDELPQHSVNLSDYHIGKYEVTRGEYRTFINLGGYSDRSYWSADGWSWRESNAVVEPAYWDAAQYWGSSPGDFTQTDDHPVVGVSYYEAEAFCKWAGGHLPTEAQWEKAARWTGSHSNVYPWGDDWDAQKCNNWFDSLYSGYQTAPVGSYPLDVSPYGCQDMAGNLVEWCRDWYQSNYYSVSPASDPHGPANGSYRVLRGGGWGSGGEYDARCASRFYYTDPYVYSDNLGFRMAR